jgi:predicted anti-sigma-YlaC factor YlaD
MRCDKVKEFLFTDYIDGILDKETTASMDKHIAECSRCREVKEAVMATSAALKGAKRETPPAYIWHRVKEAVRSEKREEKKVFGGILDTLKDLLTGPRYVFARATAVALIILVLVFAGFAAQRHYMTRQISGTDIISLVSFDLDGDEIGQDLGTDIEKCFL